MKQFSIALIIAITAGLIDIMPMVKKKINPYSTAAIFVQWVLIGLAIVYINLDLVFWLKGAILGFVGLLPFFILTYYRNPKTIPLMVTSAIALGSTIAFLNYVFN